MALRIDRKSDNRVLKAIAHRIADIPGGVTVCTKELGGKALLEGTPLAKGSDGMYHVVKTAKVLSRVETSGTEIQVAKGHHFVVGEFIGNGTKAQKITKIDKSAADKDVITITAQLGVATEAGSVLVDCKNTDQAAKLTPCCIAGTSYTIEDHDNMFVDAWLMAVVYEKNAPGVDAAMKSALNCVKYI